MPSTRMVSAVQVTVATGRGPGSPSRAAPYSPPRTQGLRKGRARASAPCCWRRRGCGRGSHAWDQHSTTPAPPTIGKRAAGGSHTRPRGPPEQAAPSAGPEAPSKPAGFGTGASRSPGRLLTATLPRVVPGPRDALPTYRRAEPFPRPSSTSCHQGLLRKGPSARRPGGRSPARRRDSHLVPQLVAVRVGDAGGTRGATGTTPHCRHRDHELPHKGFLHGINLTVFCVFQKDFETTLGAPAGTGDHGPGR